MDAARCRRGRKPLSATPIKSEERRGKAASGPPFLWILSFGGAKESISPAGARTGLKSRLAKAKHHPNKPTHPAWAQSSRPRQQSQRRPEHHNNRNQKIWI